MQINFENEITKAEEAYAKIQYMYITAGEIKSRIQSLISLAKAIKEENEKENEI